MASSIPPGFVFKPTDQKLITLYLKPKAMGSSLPCNRILDRNLYGKNGTPWIIFSNNDPWEIVGESDVCIAKKEIYVFTTLEKMNRRHMVRVAGCGTWTGKSKPKHIKNCKGKVIGVKKSFTFKVNGDLKQDETNMKIGRWIMHEYTLAGSSLEGVDNTDYAICRISWDLPKCHVKEEVEKDLNDQELNSEAAVSWATEMTVKEGVEKDLNDQELKSEAAVSWPTEMTFKEGVEKDLNDQKLNSEAAVSWPTEMTFKEEVEKDLNDQKLNSEAAVSWPTEMTGDVSRCIEEMTWNQALYDQEMNFDAAVSWPTEMTDDVSRCIEEMTWNQALHDQELNSEAAVSWPIEMTDEEVSRWIEECYPL